MTTLQCDVTVNDNGYPISRSDSATITVVINRDTNVPVFDRPIYIANALENSPVGTTVTTVSATRPNAAAASRNANVVSLNYLPFLFSNDIMIYF